MAEYISNLLIGFDIIKGVKGPSFLFLTIYCFQIVQCPTFLPILWLALHRGK